MKIKDWDLNLKIRLFGEGAINITFWMFFPFLAIYFTDSFGKDKAGFLLVVSQILSVFANLLGGYCSDRFGRKRMMVLSSFGQGIGFFLFALGNSPWLISPWLSFISFTFVSFFGSIYWPASQAMVADVVEEKDRNSVFAVFYTALNIAVVIGPILGAIFYANYLFELLLAAGAICVGLSMVLAKWTRETVPTQLNKSTDGERWYSFLVNQFRDYSIIVRDRVFLLFIIAGVLAAQTFMQLDLLFPVYIKEFVNDQTLFTFGNWSFTVQGEQAFGVILAENGLLVAIFTVIVTKWMNNFKERNVFVLSSLLYAISIILMGQTSWIWGLIIVMAIFTLGELVSAGLQQSFISRISPENMRGQYFAAASLRYTVGRTIAPLSIPLTVWIGYEWTFIVLCFLALLSGFFYWLMFAVYEKTTAKQLKKNAI